MNPAGLSVTRIPYKNYGSSCLRISQHGNDRVLVLIPGMTLPAEAFFNIPILDDNRTIADEIVSLGYDVAFFDPIGYGDSRGLVTELCLRDILAEQLSDAVTLLEEKYNKIYLQGFCTTHHVPLIVATKKSIAGVLIMSPYRTYPIDETFEEFYSRYKDSRNNFQQRNFFINFSVLNLSHRLQYSDDIVCQLKNTTNRAVKLDNWKELINSCVVNFKRFSHINGWLGVRDMTHDPVLYPNLHEGLQGWHINDITCPIASIRGEFDFEFILGEGQLTLDHIQSNLVSNIEVAGASHFGMWDNVCHQWSNDFLKSLLALG